MTSFLKFGILCNGLSFQKWQADAIRNLCEKGHEPVLLIMDPRITPHRGRFERLRIYPWKRLFFNLYHRYRIKPDSKKIINLGQCLANIPAISCQPDIRGHAEYFRAEDLQLIRSYHCDFILRFGFNILRGDILNVSRFGIWSFHHDDEMKYRGGPPAFWEIYFNDPVTGAILQRLTEKLDAGIVLKKGYLKTQKHSYTANLDQMLSASSLWPMLVAEEIRNGRDHFSPPSHSNAAIFHVPANRKMIRFLLRLFWNYLSFQYHELFRAEFWNVGVIDKPVEDIAFRGTPLRQDEIIWNPKVAMGHYLADPYGFIEERKIHILLEDYNYFQGKANIAEVIYNPATKSFSVPLSAIEGEKHLSYPFIIVHDRDNVYCIPESYRNRTIELYKRNFSEGSFVEQKVLISDIDAIDPTIIRYGKYWWIFFTLRPTSNSHLYIYYSPQLDGPYIPHRMNPVKIDITSSRPGGTPFVHQGFLFRPAQDCSESYGRRVVVNRIVKLTPDDFEEVIAGYVDPPHKGSYTRGLHTLSSVGGYTLIDGKRYRFSQQHFFRQLRMKINRDRGRNA